MLALVLSVAIAALAVPVPSFAAAAKQTTGQISGTVKTADGQPLAGQKVQLRDSSNGRVFAITTTDNAGRYSFNGLPQGNYLVEVLDARGKLASVSMPIALTATQMSADVPLVLGPGLGAVAAAGGAGHFFGTTAGIVTLAAAGAGVAGIVYVAKRNASPSK